MGFWHEFSRFFRNRNKVHVPNSEKLDVQVELLKELNLEG